MLGKQIAFRLDSEAKDEEPWAKLPLKSRERIFELYARLITRIARCSARHASKETRSAHIHE